MLNIIRLHYYPNSSVFIFIYMYYLLSRRRGKNTKGRDQAFGSDWLRLSWTPDPSEGDRGLDYLEMLLVNDPLSAGFDSSWLLKY